MDLRQLEYFVTVAELGSFSRAALTLDVAQPALSRQVRLLEVELRQNLLQRHGRGAVPTEAGQVLLEHARGILHQVGRARDELARLRGGLTGRVAVGLPPSVARALAVPLVRAFGRQLPEAHLSIAEALSTNMQEQVASGRLDIAVLYNARPVPGLEIAPLAMDELVLVQSARAAPRAARHAHRPAGAGAPAAGDPQPAQRHPHARRAPVGRLGVQPQVALEIDGVAAILDLVADGAGCAVLSRHALAAGARPAIFQLRSIETGPGQSLRIPLFTALSPLRPATGAQRAVLALLQELAPQYLG
jgi:LysR family nitrogen assimilation transcriptional regulator